jgi:hypothetical protein
MTIRRQLCFMCAIFSTRRQIIAWGAAALGGLAVEQGFRIPGVFAQSDSARKEAPLKISRRDIDALTSASILYIATVRKDGNQSTAAPVWFTVSPDNRVLIQTQPNTWKAKRVRRHSPMIVWIGRRHGPAFIGRAEISEDPSVVRQIVDDYPKKYLLARLGFHRPTEEMFKKGSVVSIVITPVRDLPEGFASQPGTPAPTLAGSS